MADISLGGKSVPQFAKDWEMGESTVWLHIKQGRIHAVKIGPRITRITNEEERRLAEQGGISRRETEGVA